MLDRLAPDSAKSSLPELFEAALKDVAASAANPGGAEKERLAALIKEAIPEGLRDFAPGCTVRGSVGIGTTAEVPWVAIFGGNEETSAQRGFYLVYLFAADGSSVFLSLLQGTEHLRGGLAALRKRAIDLRHAAGANNQLTSQIDLASPALRPRKYEAATAYAIQYRAGAIPPTNVIGDDLERMLQLLRNASDSGLDLSSDFEPIHLLLKWSTQYAEDTVARHKAVADERGSTWWGAMSKRERVLSESNVATIREQIDADAPTFAFLYGNQEVWRARIRELTEQADDVDDQRRPAHYSKEGCRLFLRLSDFEQLPPTWPKEHLVLGSNPSESPDVLGSALGNQTSPLIVYRLFDAEAEPESPPVPGDALAETMLPELTFEWLEEQTLLEASRLEQVVTALRETSPQVILAGPPGTSKTWIGLALARYLTQDRPLGHRIVQFHASYGYEEFVEGLRPVARGGNISFERVDGVVLQMASEMDDPEEITVLVIDEMNRGNLPRVFGELMFLFEYRDQAIDLLYSKDFKLPRGLRFVGTMNTADRSIRSLDIALRRRFDVFELQPSRLVLERYFASRSNEVPSLFDGFDSLNEELESLLDRHHTIGHAFFMVYPMTFERLEQIWSRKLEPLIEEYFFDQPDVASTFTLERFWPT